MRIYFGTLPEKGQKESLDEREALYRLYSYYFLSKVKNKERILDFIGRPQESVGSKKMWEEKLRERTEQAVKGWQKEKERRNEKEERKAEREKREAMLERKGKRKRGGAAITGYIETPQGQWPHDKQFHIYCWTCL